ncbi:MAG: Antitoxin Phd YefM, type toxin-antitoxin system [Hyphomicrobiales bacterium]|jgi:prevent-host-death family protein|nr:Antitoxin Phd YefM, type toxin-antitoxin system [Hyphomicrobiales bacterium]
MLDRKPSPSGPTTVGAYEAKTKFSELIARAEKGESFVVTKNGRPVAEIKPPKAFDRERARQAGERILARLDAAPKVSEAEAQRNWEETKRMIEEDREQEIDRWLKS